MTIPLSGAAKQQTPRYETMRGRIRAMRERESFISRPSRRRYMFVQPTGKPLKVSFFGHFGSPNPGNESTLIAILARLRSLYPDGEFRCICTNPRAVVATYGIQAIAITTRRAEIRNREAPLVRRVPMAFVGLGAELAQYARAFRELKRTDMLIVSGTGVVNDAFGLSPWGPYGQFKWVVMAKLRRCKVLFVSVGAGPIDRTLGQVLVKATLSMADYRSYRDDASRDYLTGIGFRAEGDRVYPDLAFSLPETLLRGDHARSPGTRRTVGLGLMVYPGKYSAVDPRAETYTAYLESLAALTIWLLEHDYDIRLLLGDSDTIVINEFRSVLNARLGSYDEERIVDHPIESVEDILAELAASDIVVATRFHNVLHAMLLNKPVIAISFHHKVSSLMQRMGLTEYCHDIHQIDADRLIAQVRMLEDNEAAVRRMIARGAAEERAALEEQYDLLFGLPRRGSTSDAPVERDRLRPLETGLQRVQ